MMSAKAAGSIVLPRDFSSAFARADRPLSPGASHSTVAPALPIAVSSLVPSALPLTLPASYSVAVVTSTRQVKPPSFGSPAASISWSSFPSRCTLVTMTTRRSEAIGTPPAEARIARPASPGSPAPVGGMSSTSRSKSANEASKSGSVSFVRASRFRASSLPSSRYTFSIGFGKPLASFE